MHAVYGYCRICAPRRRRVEVVGFVRAQNEEDRGEVDGLPVLGAVADLDRVIAAERIEDVLIALRPGSPS